MGMGTGMGMGMGTGIGMGMGMGMGMQHHVGKIVVGLLPWLLPLVSPLSRPPLRFASCGRLAFRQPSPSASPAACHRAPAGQR